MSWPGGFFFEDLKMSFDQIIVQSSSPTFCNIKPGNLFFVKNEDFPHEVGVIIGYPVEDVIEFENHQGHDCKYCGCWKSYSDVDKARDCHCRFTECSRLCTQWYDEGYSINQIITKYQILKTVA